MQKKYFSLLILLAVQACSPEFMGPVLVDNKTSGNSPCEPSIAINPTNPDNIVAAAIMERVYVSNDGGKSWSHDRAKSPLGVYGDPCIITDTSGNFYYFHLSDPEGKGRQSQYWLDRIVCQRSEDGGRSWTEGSSVGYNHPKDQDKEWSVYDPHRSRLYTSWTQFDKYGSENPADRSNILVSWSDDKGDTWSEPRPISDKSGDCLDDDQTTEGAVPAAGPNGELYVAWAYDEKIWFDASADGGSSWLPQDVVVAEQPGGWTFNIPGIYRCNGMPVTVADRGNSPYRGNVYVNWSDQRNGADNVDIWLARSSDGGRSWAEPVRVNTDASQRQQFMSWMAVDQETGNVYVVFYDRRTYDDTRTDVYLAWSEDGGASFQNLRLTERPFLPNQKVFFGDYTNISAHEGRIAAVWTEMHNAQLSVWSMVLEHGQLKKRLAKQLKL